MSSLRCALACTVAGNQGRGLAAYTQLASTLKSLMATCGGATRIQLRASARGAVKVLIPLIMETPYVGVRMDAMHEDRQITRSLRTCWVDWSKIYFE